MDIPITNKYFQEAPLSTDHAKEQLVMANRILAGEGVFDSYGHISIRNPENHNTCLISRARSPADVEYDDIIEIDFQTKIVSGNPNYTTFGECAIHCAIYAARPDVMSVSHPHPPEAIPFTCTDIPLKGVHHLFCTFYEGVPVFSDIPPEDGLLIRTLEVGEKLAAVLGNKRGVLIRNHGVVVVGESVPRAVFSSITLRDNARILLNTLAMGAKPSYIGYEESEYSTYIHFSGQGFQRSWDYWVARAKNNFSDIADLCL